jgi:hypothetical protein
MLALILWATGQGEPVKAPPELPPVDSFAVTLVSCYEANICLMNIVGDASLLGQQVGVRIVGYQAPRQNGYYCLREKMRALKATMYLEEILKNGDVLVLREAKKPTGSAFLTATLLVDGVNVASTLVGLRVVAPAGVRVNWCGKTTKWNVGL